MTRDSGKDHERIWLQSYDDTEALGEDRLWCQDKVWPDDPEDHEPTEYIRADLFAALEAERDELRAALEPFAHSDMEWDIHEDNVTVGACDFTQGDLRRARAVYDKGDA